ncbi:MAG: hypothetical protein ACT4OX_02995 [Actinomycetota bacterium]
MGGPESPQVDELGGLGAQVAARRAEGMPRVDDPPLLSPAVYAALEDAVDALSRFEYNAQRIDLTSSRPVGSVVHRLVAKTVVRQVQGVLAQSQEYAHGVHRVLENVVELMATWSREFGTGVVEQLDDLQTRIAEQRRTITEMRGRIDDLEQRVRSRLPDG